MMSTVPTVISDSPISRDLPRISRPPPFPVSVNRTVPDLATSDNKRKQLQERKLNIPADAFDWSVCVYVCVCVCVCVSVCL